MFKHRLLLFVMILCVALTSCTTVSAREISAPLEADSYASITIYAYDSNARTLPLAINMGHSFIAIENKSASSFIVGNYEVAPGETVTIGTWGQSAHWGIWYNLETFYMANGYYNGIVSITRAITAQDITVISDFVLESDYWEFTRNCTDFAVQLWNKVAESDKINLKALLIAPTNLKKKLSDFTICKTNNYLTEAVTKNPCYFNGTELVSFTAAEAA